MYLKKKPHWLNISLIYFKNKFYILIVLWILAFVDPVQLLLIVDSSSYRTLSEHSYYKLMLFFKMFLYLKISFIWKKQYDSSNNKLLSRMIGLDSLIWEYK